MSCFAWLFVSVFGQEYARVDQEKRGIKHSLALGQEVADGYVVAHTRHSCLALASQMTSAVQTVVRQTTLWGVCCSS